MLEEIEESVGQITVLRSAVAYYLKGIHDQIVECEQQVQGLSGYREQLKSLLSQGNRIESELQVLTEQRTSLEAQLKPLRPYFTIINKIEELGQTIREKEALVKQKQQAITREIQGTGPVSKLVQQETEAVTDSLSHQSLVLEVEITRLGADREYQCRRLRELNMTTEAVKTQEIDIQLRISAVDEIIQKKHASVNAVSMLVEQQKQSVQLAQPAVVKLQGLQQYHKHLVEVVRIVNGVAIDAEAVFESESESVSTQESGVSV